MNLLDIIEEENVENKISILNDEKDLIIKLYSYENQFSLIIDFLIEDLLKDLRYENFSKIFIDILVVKLLNKPSDLITCLKAVKKKEKQLFFLKTVMRHHLINDDLLISLGNDTEVFKKLPKDLDWTEVPIIKYASMKIRFSDKKMNIKQIIPLYDYISDNSIVEYLLGWAFEDNKLDDCGVDFFKTNFNKKYNTILSLKKMNL